MQHWNIWNIPLFLIRWGQVMSCGDNTLDQNWLSKVKACCLTASSHTWTNVDIFKCIFLNENAWIPIIISLKFALFLRVQLTLFQHWLKWWLGAVQATSHYLNQVLFVYWYIYASLCPNVLKYHVVWRHQANVDPVPCHHMVSLGLNELGNVKCTLQMISNEWQRWS